MQQAQTQTEKVVNEILNTQGKVETILDASIEELEDTGVFSEQAIREIKASQSAVDELAKEKDSRFKKIEYLENKLKEHDLDYLAEKRPGWVEKIVDKGSDDMLRCLEIISGSPLTEEELNAKVKSKANTQCPDLANPNFRD